MMTKLFSTKRLNDSTGSGKVTHNNAMQPASPTTKTPWFLWIQETINLRGLARAVGLGLLCGQPNKVMKTAENAPQTAMEQKTPLNRIGLGKKAIIAFLALATMMTTSIEQIKAQSSGTNKQHSTRVSPFVTIWTNAEWTFPNKLFANTTCTSQAKHHANK